MNAVSSALSPPLNRRSSRERGSAAVEAAVMFPVWILIMGACFDLGLGYLASHQLQAIARQTARQAAALMPYSYFAAESVRYNSDVELSRVPALSSTVLQLNPPMDVPSDAVTDKVVEARASGVYRFHFLRMIGLREITLQESATARYEWQVEKR
jgi:Flp pilus assembly protein TadG